MANSYLKHDSKIEIKAEPLDDVFKQEINEDDYKCNEENGGVLSYGKKSPKEKFQFNGQIETGNFNVEQMKAESNESYCKYSGENKHAQSSIKEENIDIEYTVLFKSELPKEEQAEVQEFSCFICGEEFKSESQLDEHIETTDHEQGNVEFSTNREKIFAEQIGQPENVGSGNKEIDKVPLITTNVEHTSEGKVYKCVKPGCENKFFFKCHLLAHIRLHNNDRPFKCTYENCEAAFILNSQLRRHKLIHSGVKPFKCSVAGCTKSFVYKVGLRTHMRAHSEKMPFNCNSLGCYRGFETKEALLEHKLVHVEDLPFKCSFEGCTRSFSYEVTLRNHTSFHTNGYPRREHLSKRNSKKRKEDTVFKCNFENCTKEYRESGKLKDHMRRHNVDKPFKCDVDGCGKSFHFNHALMTHKKRHSNERPHKCEHQGCDKSFKCKGSLWCHMKTHLTEKLFVCTSEGCGKSFTHPKLLKEHMRVHSKERPSYVCEICSLKFKWKCTLYRHTRKVHKIDLATEPDHKSDGISEVGSVKTENA